MTPDLLIAANGLMLNLKRQFPKKETVDLTLPANKEKLEAAQKYLNSLNIGKIPASSSLMIAASLEALGYTGDAQRINEAVLKKTNSSGVDSDTITFIQAAGQYVTNLLKSLTGYGDGHNKAAKDITGPSPTPTHNQKQTTIDSENPILTLARKPGFMDNYQSN